MMTQIFPVHKTEGFTLIEVLIYIALLGILLSGIIAAVYPIFTNSDQLSRKITNDTEAGFLVRKLAWALSSVDSITEPNLGNTSDTLTVDTVSGDTLSFSPNDGNVILSLNGSDEPLLSSRVTIKNLLFTYQDETAPAPDALFVEFDVNGEHVGPIRHNVYVE